MALETGGRRSTGGSDWQQHAVDQHLTAERAPCVVETRRARGRRRGSAGADVTGRARSAVVRGSEVAQEVVVLELAREQEEGVERYAEERSAIPPPVSHLIDDITGQ
jgi:hypothetical protein